MATVGGAIELATYDSYEFTNSKTNDLLIYPNLDTQSVLLGVKANQPALVTCTSNAIAVAATQFTFGAGTSVGIGTAAPSVPLDVSGTVKATTVEAGDVNISGVLRQNGMAMALTVYSFATGGQYGTAAAPINGGTLAVNTSTAPNAIVELASTAPAPALNINFTPVASFDNTGQRGSLVIIERSLTGRALNFDARIKFSGNSAPTATSAAPILNGWSVDSLDYYIPTSGFAVATYSRLFNNVPPSAVVRWAANLGGAGWESAVALSRRVTDGGCYMVGSYSNLDGPTTGSTMRLFSPAGVALNAGLSNDRGQPHNTFVSRYSPDGTPLWLAAVAGSNGTVLTRVNSCSTASDNGLLVAGSFNSTSLVAFNQDNTRFSGQVPTRNGFDNFQRGFLVKYNEGGNAQWIVHTSAAESQNDAFVAVAATPTDGGCVIAANLNSASPQVIDIGNNGSIIPSTVTAGNTFAALIKADSTGRVTLNSAGWVARSVPAAGTSVQARGVAVLNDGTIVMCGVYSSTLGFQNTAGATFGTQLSASGQDVFLVRYAANGSAVLWVTRISGASAEDVKPDGTGSPIAALADGGFAVCGTFTSSALQAFSAGGASPSGLQPPNAGGTDAFVVKYTDAGAVSWVGRMAGSSAERPVGVAQTSDAGLVVAGTYASAPLTAFNAGGGVFATTLANSGNDDTFLVKYDAALGNVQWVARIAGAGFETASAVVVTPDDGVVVAGTTRTQPNPGSTTVPQAFVFNRLGSAFSTALQPTVTQLYTFSSHTFTPAGRDGRFGPTLNDVRSAYSTVTWAQQTTFLNVVTQGVQLWTVPVTGSYAIYLVGGYGGGYDTSDNGHGPAMGINITASFNVGDVVAIAVGQRGIYSTNNGSGGYTSAGGGGMTAMYRNNVLMATASGGRGYHVNNGAYGAGTGFASDADTPSGGIGGGATGGVPGGDGSAVTGSGGAGGSHTFGGNSGFGGGGGGGGSPRTLTGGVTFLGGTGGLATATGQSGGDVTGWGGFGGGGGGGGQNSSYAQTTGGGGGGFVGSSGWGNNVASVNYTNSALCTRTAASTVGLGSTSRVQITLTAITPQTDSFLVKMRPDGMMS